MAFYLKTRVRLNFVTLRTVDFRSHSSGFRPFVKTHLSVIYCLELLATVSDESGWDHMAVGSFQPLLSLGILLSAQSSSVFHCLRFISLCVMWLKLCFNKWMYEGWNFNFGNTAVTFDTAHLQSSYFHRPSMYSPKLCRTRCQRWGSRMMPLAAPVLLMVRTERSTAEGLNPPCNCPIR